MPQVQVIAIGSSSFQLRNSINEPLTGRGLEFILLPFSLNEIKQLYRPHEIDTLFPFFMRFGLYPEIIEKSEAAAETLITNLASKYLYGLDHALKVGFVGGNGTPPIAESAGKAENGLPGLGKVLIVY